MDGFSICLTIYSLQYIIFPFPSEILLSVLDVAQTHILQDLHPPKLIEFQGQVLPFCSASSKGLSLLRTDRLQFSITCHNSSFSHRSGTKGVMQSRVAGAELPSKLIVHWEFQSFWEHLNSGKIDERLLGLYSFSFWRRIFSNFFFSFHGLLQWGLDAFGGALEHFERGEVGIKELTVFFGLYSILIKSRNKKLILFLIIALQNSVFQKKIYV